MAGAGGCEAGEGRGRESRWCVGRECYGRYLMWLHSDRERGERAVIAAKKLALAAQLVCVLRGRATDTLVQPSVLREAGCEGDGAECPLLVRLWMSRDCGC